MKIHCNPPRTYAPPAAEPEVVYVAEPRTRTAIVLGVRVEIPIQKEPHK